MIIEDSCSLACQYKEFYGSFQNLVLINFFLFSEQNERKQSSTEPDITTSNSPLGVINEGATIPDDEANN